VIAGALGLRAGVGVTGVSVGVARGRVIVGHRADP
jgi:hypothetical protein